MLPVLRFAALAADPSVRWLRRPVAGRLIPECGVYCAPAGILRHNFVAIVLFGAFPLQRSMNRVLVIIRMVSMKYLRIGPRVGSNTSLNGWAGSRDDLPR